jgi:hypothetical protein
MKLGTIKNTALATDLFATMLQSVEMVEKRIAEENANDRSHATDTIDVIEMLRVSSDKQDVARQEFDAQENREQHNLNVLRTIRIKISGTLVMTHPEVKQMVAELSYPAVDGISVSAIDRLFRPKDFQSLQMFQFFAENRKVIISTKEGLVEPWTDRGWDICMNAAQKAGAEWRELKRRTSGGCKRARAEKRMCCTTAPYGMVYVSKYERDADGRAQYLREDPKESSVPGLTKREVVRDVFHWRYYHQMRTSTIQRRLNDRGILTAGKLGQFKPGPWSRTTVIQMLKNRHYVGEHWEGGTMIPCPQFVEREVFEGVQRTFAEAKELSNGRPATKHLLCGFLRCAKCGRRYRTVTGGSGRYPAYVCGNYDYKLKKQVCRANCQVRTNKIEAVVWSAIWHYLTQPEILLANAKAYYDSLPTKTGTGKLEKELATVKSRMERTKRMVRAGTYDEDTGIALILEDKQRIVQLEAELRAAGSVVTLPPAYVIQAACERIVNSGAKLETFGERRPVLEKLVDLKVTYDNGAVDIEGKVPVPAVALKCDSGVSADADQAGRELRWRAPTARC